MKRGFFGITYQYVSNTIHLTFYNCNGAHATQNGGVQKEQRNLNEASAIISLNRWLQQVGVTPCTAWRWRKKGWLKTVNICGRQYLTQEAIAEFSERAKRGEFSQVPKVPSRAEARP